ncbi:LacI family transcriptional regulator, partial [Aeromonas salmonicida]|nr:LacI family transcriptional regulator [Aeromonas salmonicida]
RKMGQEAAELILRQLAGEPVMGTALTLDFQLQKRQSS